MKYGPGRSELLFRLTFSLVGLAFLAGAIAFRGISGIASAELVLIALAFFGGTVIWSARSLWRDR
jgi:hypothetical protein